MSELKSLQEHNTFIVDRYANLRKPIKNGIACPKCGSELWDTIPGLTLTSNPPQKDVHCEKCDYRGYRNC